MAGNKNSLPVHDFLILAKSSSRRLPPGSDFLEFPWKIVHSMLMPDREPMPRKQPPEDEWGTTSRIGYEDRPTFRQPRKVVATRKGSRPLRTFGSLLVVVGLAWLTYVATSPDGIGTLIKPGVPPRPVLVLSAGLLILLLEKLVK